MTELPLNDSRSWSTMPRRSRSNVQIRGDHSTDGRVAWPSATSSQTTKVQPVRSSPVKHVGARTNLAIDAWRRTKLVDLCNYLEHHDHVQLRNQLAAMTGTVAAAVATYIESDHNVLEISQIYVELRRDMWTHMFREEHGLYSSICNVELHRGKPFYAPGILTDEILGMKREHRQFARAFRRIARLLRDYEIPANAGHPYRDLVQGFRELEASKLQHMQHEDIMYSRALALEKQPMGK